MFSKIVGFFMDYSPERETNKALTQARLLLVDHKCMQEYYNASVPMLENRVARLEGEKALNDTKKAARQPNVRKHTQAPALPRDDADYPSVFSFTRKATQ